MRISSWRRGFAATGQSLNRPQFQHQKKHLSNQRRKQRQIQGEFSHRKRFGAGSRANHRLNLSSPREHQFGQVVQPSGTMEVDHIMSDIVIHEHFAFAEINEVAFGSTQLKNLAIDIAVNEDPSEVQETSFQVFIGLGEAPINEKEFSSAMNKACTSMVQFEVYDEVLESSFTLRKSGRSSRRDGFTVGSQTGRCVRDWSVVGSLRRSRPRATCARQRRRSPPANKLLIMLLVYFNHYTYMCDVRAVLFHCLFLTTIVVRPPRDFVPTLERIPFGDHVLWRREKATHGLASAPTSWQAHLSVLSSVLVSFGCSVTCVFSSIQLRQYTLLRV